MSLTLDYSKLHFENGLFNFIYRKVLYSVLIVQVSSCNQGAVIEGVETNCSPLKSCSAPQRSYALCYNCYPGALTKECISNQGMTLQKLKRPFRQQQFVVPFNVLATMNVCATNWTSEPNSV